jgi:hypothetical protein
MPLTKKGKKIKRAMESFYGKKVGDRVFYASENAGRIKGVARGRARFAMTDAELEGGLRFLRGHAAVRGGRVKSAEELTEETEFYRRRSLPRVRTEHIGGGGRAPLTVVLKHDQLGEIGSKTEVLKRGKVTSVLYVLPPLEKGHSMRRRHSIRRRGHAATSKKLRVVYRSPTGTTVWQLPDSDMQIMWNGPGGRLRIGWSFMKAGGSMGTLIDHHTANGDYKTRKEAEAAIKSFIASGGVKF